LIFRGRVSRWIEDEKVGTGTVAEVKMQAMQEYWKAEARRRLYPDEKKRRSEVNAVGRE
jgi:hypothetical protein